MFYYLNGNLEYLDASFCAIDCNGVGYGLTISQITSSLLSGKVGSKTKLYTYLAVREDGMELFGFMSDEERSAFNKLTSVSGVGPKAAISILSTLTPDKFSIAVCTEDVKAISKASGIGPKTAARIVLELKDKLQKEAMVLDADDLSMMADHSPAAAMGKKKDAEDALTVLGYSRSEASAALRSIDTEKLELDDIIRLALKKLMR